MDAHTTPSPPASALPDALAHALSDLLGERFTMNRAVRQQHGSDESSYPCMPPDAVVWPESTDEVAAVMRLCARHATPVVAFGAGSSVEGHVLALHGGVCVDLSRMDRVLSIDPQDLSCTVQAGVTREALNSALADSGFFFSVDPGADATLGGMAATGASGTNTVRYGTMRDNLLSLTVVLADGDVVRTARRARKSSAGYNLTQLFAGSEGTLGLITEVTVRLHPQPEAVAAAVVHFPGVRRAVEAVIQVLQMGVPLARAELLDALSIRAINAHSHTTLAEQPTLFLEFCGSDAQVREQAEVVQAVMAEHGGGGFQWATRPEERRRLWTPRHHAYFAACSCAPAAAPCPPTPACRCHAWPTAWPRRRPTSKHRALSPRSSATWGTAISTACCWWTRPTPAKWRAPNHWPTGWFAGPSPWTAPAAASTAWACTKSATWKKSTARPAWH